jgi:flagellar basal-body rod modification protein FlgD
MSSISPIGTTGSSQPGPSKTLGKDDFLRLLMAQMSNQDPLSPTDDTAFIAQLAQFSSVEQLQSANENLGNLLLAQAAANQTSAAGLVGKDVQFRTTEVQLGTGPATLSAQLDSAATSVSATISDSTGHVVRTLDAGSSPAGALSLAWDGRDESGSPVGPGAYTVSITALDARGNAVPVTQSATGRVSGISFAGGVPRLVVDGQQISLSDVIEIDQPIN